MIWDFLQGMFSSGTGTASSMDGISSPIVNPATGLPMLDASIGGVDVGGSPYGMDINGSTGDLGSGFGSTPWG